MNRLQPNHQLINQLNVPLQDLAQLSFCDGRSEQSIQAWVHSLPLTQMQFVGGLLYQALPEVSRFQTTPSTRLTILEHLRSPSLQTVESLAQSFLNQPLILPEHAVKTATIAQALQKHLVNGYLVVVRDLCKDAKPNLDLLSLAIHRSITGLSLLLLRSYQLYVPISGHIWGELHSLYQIALSLEIQEQPVAEPYPRLDQCNTVALTYTRALLLACARPNQLRQDEILSTFEALNNLSALAQLQVAQPENHDNLFAVALNSNRPPHYRSRFKYDERALILELNTAAICKKLIDVSNEPTVESAEHSGLRNSLDLSAALTSHLRQAWNLLSQRNFDRKQTSGNLEVTLGLTNIHYYLSGNLHFTHFLNRTGAVNQNSSTGSIFQKRDLELKDNHTKKANDDPWNKTFDIVGTALQGKTVATNSIELAIVKQESQEIHEDHPIYHIPLIDVSHGGYCIEWRDSIPNQVKAGELLGIRNPTQNNRWSIGVVRWANQTKGATQLGIQIITALATPVGLAVIHKTGDSSEYLRAIEVPALKALNQPATLITNAISFREYTKARLFLREEENSTEPHIVQLTRRLFATGAFSQFTYRNLSTPKGEVTNKQDDLDTDWTP